jgi:hypothetical protein
MENKEKLLDTRLYDLPIPSMLYSKLDFWGHQHKRNHDDAFDIEKVALREFLHLNRERFPGVKNTWSIDAEELGEYLFSQGLDKRNAKWIRPSSLSVLCKTLKKLKVKDRLKLPITTLPFSKGMIEKIWNELGGEYPAEITLGKFLKEYRLGEITGRDIDPVRKIEKILRGLEIFDDTYVFCKFVTIYAAEDAKADKLAENDGVTKFPRQVVELSISKALK